MGKNRAKGAGHYRWRRSPAARGSGWESKRGNRRTSRWLRDGSGWPMAAGPRAPAAGGGRRWRRQCSGGVEVVWSGRELHLDMRELEGCLIWAEEGRRSGSTASRAAAADVQRRRGVPVKIGRGGWVGELRGPTVELSRGSAQAERFCSGGPAAASSSPGFTQGGGGVLRV